MKPEEETSVKSADLIFLLKVIDRIVGSLDNISHACPMSDERLERELLTYFQSAGVASDLAKARRCIERYFDSSLQNGDESPVEILLKNQKYWRPKKEDGE